MSIQDLEVPNDYDVHVGSFQMPPGAFQNYLFTADNNGIATWLPLVLTTNPTISAHVGGGQANATPLFAGFSVVNVVASDHDSVILPSNLLGPTNLGRLIIVKNTGANILDVFPQVGGSINALAANTADNIASGSTKIYCAVTTSNWQSTS